jgi:myosin heavy subunit
MVAEKPEKEKSPKNFLGIFSKATSPRGSTVHAGAAAFVQRTISSVFMNQLGELMKTLKTTESHYVRCIRPNESNAPNIFDEILVNEQLKNW